MLNNTYVLPILSDPCDPDSDGDGLEDCTERNLGTDAFDIDTDNDFIDDEEEYIIELDPLNYDTDGDSLTDGFEYSLGYDPYDPNPDGDKYTDYEEYVYGHDPYVYEYVKNAFEHIADIGYGALYGDFVDDDEVDTDVLIGQIGGSFIPIVGDARDFVANVIKGNPFMALMSVVGLVPIGGDAVKTVANLGETLVKLGDDVPAATKLVLEVAEEHPSIIKYMAGSDEIVEAIEASAKSDNITKEALEKVVKYADEAGIAINKTSDLFGKSDNVIDELVGVWEEGPCRRGHIIDKYINKHDGFTGLGENFPVADRVQDKVLISTKSLDLGAKSYKDPKKLEKKIQSYIDKLEKIANDYPEIKTKDGLKRGGKELHDYDYSRKLVELVIPDIPLSDSQVKILEKFLNANNISIVIVK